MSPTWETSDGAVRLYLADCLDVLPTLAGVDAVVTDPPYGCKWDGIQSTKPLLYRGRRDEPRWTGSIIGDDKPFDPTPFLDFPAVAFTGAQYFYDRLPAGGSLHCWNKKGEYKPMDQGDADMVWSKRGGACRIFDLVWRGLCRHAEHTEVFHHPTLKPVALMEWMIGLCGDPRTILDPYMGSGSTGVACARTDRRFIGIEKKPEYFEIAVQRISAELNRQPLFDEPPKVTQRELI